MRGLVLLFQGFVFADEFPTRQAAKRGAKRRCVGTRSTLVQSSLFLIPNVAALDARQVDPALLGVDHSA